MKNLVLAGIICEYNPFHMGHFYHIEETKKKTNCDGIIAVMSGNFVQRGEGAIFEKTLRAKAAISNGADIVFELSPLYAVQSAELFAKSAVKILSSIPEVKFLSFGAETDDENALSLIAKHLACESPEFKEQVKSALKTGISFPRARQEALSKILPDINSEILSSPNNILGVEYLKSIYSLGAEIKPCIIKRKGASHDSKEEEGGFFSASYLRELILKEGTSSLSEKVPEGTYKIFENAPVFDFESFSRAVLSNIINMKTEELSKIQGVTEGLENRIKKESQKAKTLDELLSFTKSKRYALSSIRRILLSSYLGIRKGEGDTLPRYIKILDFSPKGQEILNTIKKTSNLPIIKNMNGLKKESPALREEYEREIRLDKIYSLFTKEL